MKIAITGTTGFIGGIVAKELSEENYQLKGLVGSESSPLNKETKNLEIIKGRLENDDAIDNLLENVDILIHTAATISLKYGRNKSVEQTNIHLARKVFEKAVEKGVKHIIHLSSIHAYDPKGEVTVTEETKFHTRPHACYNYTKANGQKALKEVCEGTNTKYTILNPTGVLGPYNYKLGSTSKVFYLLEKGKLPVVPNGGYDFVDVYDIVEIIKKCIKQPAINETFIVGGNYYTTKELANSYAEIAKTRKPILEIPIWILKSLLPFIKTWEFVSNSETGLSLYALNTFIEGRVPIDSSKVYKHFDLKPTPLKNTLKRISEWNKTYL